MTTPDLINGTFEALGSIAVWINVQKLFVDKKVLGVRWELSLFWTSWSMWNLYYYPHLGQWLSLAGGISLGLATTIWMVMAIYYEMKNAS